MRKSNLEYNPNRPIIITGTASEIVDALKKFVNEATPPKPEGHEFKTQKMTVSEASQFIEVSYVTINKWIKEGKIPIHGKGRKRFVLKSELIEAYKNM